MVDFDGVFAPGDPSDDPFEVLLDSGRDGRVRYRGRDFDPSRSRFDREPVWRETIDF